MALAQSKCAGKPLKRFSTSLRSFGTGLKPGVNEKNFEARCRKGARYYEPTEFDFRLVANHRRNRDRCDWLRNGFEPARRFESRHLTSYRWRTHDSCSYFD